MNIVHLTKYLPPYSGGIERVTANLVRAAALSGYRVKEIGIGSHGQSDWSEVEVIPINAPVHLGPAPLTTRYYQALKKLAPELNAGDVIHLHLPNPAAEWAVSRFLGKNPHLELDLIPIAHAGIGRMRLAASVWEKLVTVPLLRQASAVLASDIALMDCFASLKHARDKTVAIPWPTESFLSESTREPGRFKVFAVGRHVPYKGFDTLIDAMARLKNPAELILAGTGPETAMLKLRTETLGIRERVSFVGEITEDQKRSLFNSTDMLVVPSTTVQETYGIVIAEGLSAGVPVITTNLPTGVQFLSRGGACGATVPPGNPLALAAAIDDLQNDEARRIQIGIANRKFWEENIQFSSFQTAYTLFMNSRNRPTTSAA